MIKVITYGTYDLLHQGHINLLKNAKKLGDYLIVGVTSDDFDKARGKINVKQSLMERIEAVKQLGIADEIIIEEYEGQKIDDIIKYNVDIFTVGSDWKGKFDYLNEFCNVVYLERTKGISSSKIRSEQNELRLGLIGNNAYLNKFTQESNFVNGIKVTGIFTTNTKLLNENVLELPIVTNNYEHLLNNVDAVYIHSAPQEHYQQVKTALLNMKHVICESPICLSCDEFNELYDLAEKNNLVLMDSLRTAYSTAFDRLLLGMKAGKIGKIVSIDASCTSLNFSFSNNLINEWGSLAAWGPTSLLPIFKLFGTEYNSLQIVSKINHNNCFNDEMTFLNILYDNGLANVKLGIGCKSENQLIITGTEGFAIVPSPWWKTDYYEFKYENFEKNKRFFYQLDGEGIRNELVMFLKKISDRNHNLKIDYAISKSIISVMEKFYLKNEFKELSL